MEDLHEEIELDVWEEKFCLEYVHNGEVGVQAFMVARPGVRYNSANSGASLLLKRPDIKKRIKQLQKIRAKKLKPVADRVLARLEARANANPRDLFDDDGKLKPIRELDPDVARCIKSIRMRRVIEGKGDDADVVEITDIQLHDGKASEELLGKNLKLWNDVGTKENPLHANVGYTVVFGDEEEG